MVSDGFWEISYGLWISTMFEVVLKSHPKAKAAFESKSFRSSLKVKGLMFQGPLLKKDKVAL